MFAKLKTLWSDLPIPGKVAVVVIALAVMYAISDYNGVVY